MKTSIVITTISVLLAITLEATGLANSPTFDCSKASAEVEKLICSDSDLISLDRKLSDVYKQAELKVTGKLKNSLKQGQRGWVSGRNDCWKASSETWITASWTVKSVRECIQAQYRLRISELQSVWRIIKPKTVYYACQNNSANEVIVNYFDSDPETIRLERGDHTVTMWQIGNSRPKLYEGRNVSLIDQDRQVKISLLNVHKGTTEELECKPK